MDLTVPLYNTIISSASFRTTLSNLSFYALLFHSLTNVIDLRLLLVIVFISFFITSDWWTIWTFLYFPAVDGIDKKMCFSFVEERIEERRCVRDLASKHARVSDNLFRSHFSWRNNHNFEPTLHQRWNNETASGLKRQVYHNNSIICREGETEPFKCRDGNCVRRRRSRRLWIFLDATRKRRRGISERCRNQPQRWYRLFSLFQWYHGLAEGCYVDAL